MLLWGVSPTLKTCKFEECRKTFTPSGPKKDEQDYCNASCRGKNAYRNRTARRGVQPKRVRCKSCGLPFVAKAGNHSFKKKYCSERCKRYAALPKHPEVKRRCAICDDEFIVSRYAPGGHKFCSKKCKTVNYGRTRRARNKEKAEKFAAKLAAIAAA